MSYAFSEIAQFIKKTRLNIPKVTRGLSMKPIGKLMERNQKLVAIVEHQLASACLNLDSCAR